MRSSQVLAVLFLSTIFSGCAYRPNDVVDPNTITLRTAIMDVADTLHAVRDKYRNEPKVGLYVDQATVTFNISAQSQETSGLQLGATVPAAVSVIPLTASLSDQTVATGARGNQITIIFKNVNTLGKSGGGSKGDTGSKNQQSGNKPKPNPQQGGELDCGGPNPPPQCNVILKKDLPKQ
jgi:hypothetical protein